MKRRFVGRRQLLVSAGAPALSALFSGCDDLSALKPPRRTAAAPVGKIVADNAEMAALLQANVLPPRYRTEQRQLLQAVPAAELPSRLPNGRPFRLDQFGPTHRWVDSHTGWPWTRPGGDWIDARGQRHGSQPWLSVPADGAQGSTESADYFADATAVVQRVQSEPRWLALLLSAVGAPRSIAGLRHPRHAAPAIDVVYQDGQRERLACRLVAGLDPSSQSPVTSAIELPLPALLEFERPARPVQSAKLRWTVTAHWAGPPSTMVAQLADPPVLREPPRPGLASQAGQLDAQLQAMPSVIGLHRYLDGTRLDDFVAPGKTSLHMLRNFDPAIYGLGKTDTSRLPHRDLGKWHSEGPPLVLVPSSYGGEGFQPLAPGLGAMRLHMPADPALKHGAQIDDGGTLAGHAMIFLPEPLYGRLDRLFVRYYLRLGLPLKVSPQQRLQLVRGAGETDWASMSGKFGIGPDHSTSIGGVSGSSGGGAGWQMRLSWYECDAGVGGPDERGIAPGFHLYDFQDANPVGHRYGRDDPSQLERWGQRGGHGGMLYAGYWYCVETEIQLNTVDARTSAWRPDGALRAWVDGRLAYERTGMVFRTLPLRQMPPGADRLPPCRELGVRSLWLNWFHGGRTPNTVPRTMFFTGLAWGTEYIGPMAL